MNLKLDRANLLFWSLLFCFLPSPTKAQSIDSDNTTSTQVKISNQKDFTITGGERTGGNLFHSFKSFSVPTNGSAFFDNDSNINNIISRVTGGSVSTIDGLIKANGNANLFLINPAGIIFGKNASLNIGGSFLGSTASSILFPNSEYGATDTQTKPILTVNAPIGLRFRGGEGEIRVQGTGSNLKFDSTSLAFIEGETPAGLQVKDNQTLALVGSGVNLSGGNLLTPGGRIEVGSVANQATVSIASVSQGLRLLYPNVSDFADIQLSNKASIDASSDRGSGDIQVKGKNISIADGSAIFAFTGSQAGGTVLIDAAELVAVTGVSADNSVVSTIYTAVSPSANGRGGNVNIATKRLIANGTAQIGADTYGTGEAGNIFVKASDLIELSGTSADGLIPTALGTFVQPEATGDGSQLIVETDRLKLLDGAQLIVASLSDGSAANLQIKANDSIELIGQGSAISSAVFGTTTKGDGGTIDVKTANLNIEDGALITASNEGIGNAGDIKVQTDDSVLKDSGSIIANTASGEGGNISINNSSLLLMSNNSTISATAEGTGNGGNIEIGSGFVVAFINENNDIIANADRGNGGNININTRAVFGLRSQPVNPFTNDIDASSRFGLQGNVAIETPDVDTSKTIVELSPNLIEPKSLVTQACSVDRAQKEQSSFSIVGRGGLPSNPTQPLNHNLIKIGETTQTNQVSQSSFKEGKQIKDRFVTQVEPDHNSNSQTIVPAQGWKRNSRGEIVLTAYPTPNTNQRLLDSSIDCH